MITASESWPDTISPASLIHQIVVDHDGPDTFTPKRLSASVGDVILFTPMDVSDTIVELTSDGSCQADNVLNAVNFSRLIFPFLVTSTDPLWFSRSSPYGDCTLVRRNRALFSLNPRAHHSVSVSSTTVTEADSVILSPISGLYWTGTALAVTAAPSSGGRPTAGWTTNNSMGTTGFPHPNARPSPTPFLGQATAMEVSSGTMCFLVAYCFIVGTFS